jgi:hypothetical protein
LVSKRITDSKRFWGPATVLAIIAFAGFAASVAVNWPGHFPPDGIAQLAQGRSGVYNFWHPPVMAWLLGLADRIIAGAPLFIVMQAGLFFAALTALASVRRPGWSGAALLGVIAASPLALIYQGLVVKDVLFADAAVAGFAAIAWAARLWARPLPRLALCVLALALLCLAALARQNGATVALIGAIGLAAVAAAKARRHRRRVLIGVTLASAAAMIIAGLGAERWFAVHSDHQPEVARQWMMLQLYDLSGAARADPTLAMPALRARAPAVEEFVRREAAPAYDVERVDDVLKLERWKAIIARPDPAVGAAWRGLILMSPGLYLADRWRVFRQVFLTPDVQACDPVLVGVDPGDAAMLKAAGLAARDTPKDDWDGDYASAFLGSPVFSHLAYAVLAAILLALAVRDAARGEIVMIATVGLLAAALAYAASFFIISIGCDYRYLYFLDVAAMAALVQRAARVRLG